MKKPIFGFAILLIVSLLMNGLAFGLGSGEFILDSLSLKKRTDDPATGTGEGKIYYKGAGAGGNDANTKLLLHMDGTGSTFTDDSDTPHTPTAQGGATQTSTPANTNLSDGVNVASFDGTDDYLSIPDSSDWDFGTGDFTIDFWVRLNTFTPVLQRLISQTDTCTSYSIVSFSNSNGATYQAHNGTTTFELNEGGVSGWSINTWYHIAIVRNGDVFKLYKDGVEADSLTSSYTQNNMTSTLDIGRTNNCSSPFETDG